MSRALATRIDAPEIVATAFPQRECLRCTANLPPSARSSRHDRRRGPFATSTAPTTGAGAKTRQRGAHAFPSASKQTLSCTSKPSIRVDSAQRRVANPHHDTRFQPQSTRKRPNGLYAALGFCGFHLSGENLPKDSRSSRSSLLSATNGKNSLFAPNLIRRRWRRITIAVILRFAAHRERLDEFPERHDGARQNHGNSPRAIDASTCATHRQ